MATIKQFHANRLNALKSTGPRSNAGKLRSRLNAVRHGLTAETVIGALEDAADYEEFEQDIAADYHPVTATERTLVARLASVLWRLRRSNSIETGLLQIQAELLKGRRSNARQKAIQPQWYGELDVAASGGVLTATATQDAETNAPQELAYCFLQASRLQFGVLDTLTRHETALWRQAAQLLFILESAARR